MNLIISSPYPIQSHSFSLILERSLDNQWCDQSISLVESRNVYSNNSFPWTDLNITMEERERGEGSPIPIFTFPEVIYHTTFQATIFYPKEETGSGRLDVSCLDPTLPSLSTSSMCVQEGIMCKPSLPSISRSREEERGREKKRQRSRCPLDAVAEFEWLGRLATGISL